MRIALISSAQAFTPPIGYGSESRVSDLAVALARRGHAVTLFAAEGSQPNGLYTLIPIPLVVGSIANLLAAEAMPFYRHRDLLLSHDVVHDLSLTARTHELLCQYGHAKSLVTLNGISFLSPEDPVARKNFVVVSECAKRHALSGTHPWMDTPFEATYGADVGKLDSCEVVRYGCDVDFYRPKSGASMLKTALYVGRPHPSKGLDVLVRLARMLPSWNFMVAWRAELEDHRQVEAVFLRETKGLQNMSFLELPMGMDHHYVKRDAMAAATVFLHPAVYTDACPSTVLEAQACGTPIVAFARGGTPELMITRNISSSRGDPRTGILVPYFRWWEDEAGIVQAFGTALELAATLDRQKVRAYAEWDLSADRMAWEYECLYQRVARGETW